MVTRTQSANRVHPAWYVFWAAFVVASLYFLSDSLVSLAAPEMQPGSTFWNRLLWYLSHAVIASPILLIAPLQFLPGLRKSRPQWHRWLGRVFLANCMIAAALGVYLGSTIFLTGSRVPLSMLGTLWFVFAATAWQAARRGDFLNHRRFAIRTFALGAAFVWVRIINRAQDDLFAFMPNEELREATKEWLTLVLPLLVTEMWLNWGPVMVRLFRREPSANRSL